MKIHRTSQNIFSEFFYVLYGSTELRFYGHGIIWLFVPNRYRLQYSRNKSWRRKSDWITTSMKVTNTLVQGFYSIFAVWNWNSFATRIYLWWSAADDQWRLSAVLLSRLSSPVASAIKLWNYLHEVIMTHKSWSSVRSTYCTMTSRFSFICVIFSPIFEFVTANTSRNPIHASTCNALYRIWLRLHSLLSAVTGIPHNFPYFFPSGSTFEVCRPSFQMLWLKIYES